MIELWRDILEGAYSVSNTGKIRSNERKRKCCGGAFRSVGARILKASPNKFGYPRVNLIGRGAVYVHRLVAESFIPNPDNLFTVNHKDCDKANNNVNNLEWASNAENVLHGWDNGCFDSMFTPIRRLDTGEVFKSQREAARSVNRSAGNLCMHLRGDQESFAGTKWEYCNPEHLTT